MPLYEYQCESCGKVHEAFSSIDQRDREDVECQFCGVTGCRRRVAAAAVVGGKSGGFAVPSGPAPT
jgi:putative FmdB family regulatory protein